MSDQLWSEESSQYFIDYAAYFVPDRGAQLDTICALLPAKPQPLHVVELCCGEGLLARTILERFPECLIHEYDGSDTMLEKARTVLQPFGERFTLHPFALAAADWRSFPWPVQAVVSSLAIHHLNGNQKRELYGKEKWMIAILMIVFALGGTSYGMAEESLAFYVLIVAVMIAAGYDSLTGVAVVMLGAGFGTLGSTVNPFATGVASGFAGVSVADGIVGRLVILILGVIAGIVFVTRYAEGVKQDPSKSLVYSQKEENEQHFLKGLNTQQLPEFTGRHKIILILFGLAFVIMIYSVIPWGDS